MSTDASLELYKVSDDFASMLRLRDIMLSEGENVGPLEAEITKYFTHEVTREKIDTVIGAYRHAETMVLAAQLEAERTKKLANSWATQAAWLKETVGQVLTVSGQKRLEGKTAGYFLLKDNGGKQPVIITKPELIPEELVQYEGRISGKAFSFLREELERRKLVAAVDVTLERIPHKGRIAEALGAKCERCDGNGVVEDFTENDQLIEGELPCKACDGDGRQKVPGAHLADRGSHVEVR